MAMSVRRRIADDDADRLYLEDETACDGQDEDCDGRVDDPWGVGDPCVAMGACGEGALECAGDDAVICDVAPGGSRDASTPEECGDRTDNDCDGAIDEDNPQGESCAAPFGCDFQQAEHPAYTTPDRSAVLCGNNYRSNDLHTACSVGWHVCLLSEWQASYPPGDFPGGQQTSWGAPQADRCGGGVWEADRPDSARVWGDNVCGSAYNPWNSGKYLVADDGATILKGSGSCCSWDSDFSADSNGDMAVYCCR